MNDDLISRQSILGKIILAEPPAQHEQRTGHWFDVGSLSCRCSVCGEIAHDRPYGSLKREPKKYCKMKYCPHCGAKMESEEE